MLFELEVLQADSSSTEVVVQSLELVTEGVGHPALSAIIEFDEELESAVGSSVISNRSDCRLVCISCAIVVIQVWVPAGEDLVIIGPVWAKFGDVENGMDAPFAQGFR